MDFLQQLLQTCLSCIKIILKSNFKISRNYSEHSNSDLVILGNGPSGIIDLLKLKQKKDIPFMAVNMFASTMYFLQLKPSYYLMSDHAFFTFSETDFQNNDPNKVNSSAEELKQYQIIINQVWRNILESNWEIKLLIPSTYKNAYIVQFAKSKNIQIQYFNYVVIKGFRWFENFCYKLKLGSPQCQNVINNCIFESIQLNFKNIYLIGVENNFHINIFVDDDNLLKNKDDHFYEVKHKVVPVVNANGIPIKMHEVFQSLHKAFFAHHRLQQYAEYKGVNIYNATKGSFIDAYPRKEIQQV